jgi:predicted transcriptional regulator of viral defense system
MTVRKVWFPMKDHLFQFLKTHETISVAEAEAMGISRAALSFWTGKGLIQRVAHGLYASVDAIPDELVLIAGRSEHIVFSHETALALHRLHNRIPLLPSFTLPTGRRSPRSLDGRVGVYHVKPEWHALGRSSATSFQGHSVPCYDVERTVCDIIRSRSRMDNETFLGAIRTYGASSRKNLPLLFRYAEEMGIARKVHQVMEVFA